MSGVINRSNDEFISTLEHYYNDGLLSKQKHPEFDLTIWNYTPRVQYGKLWDNITLQCRGLVTDWKQNTITRPFPKFFNYEELTEEQIPNEPFEVFEKVDGSLGIIFWYGGKLHFATRGSFTSEQAIRGKKMLLEKYNIESLGPEFTTLVEIIYPENRIVVDYGQEEKLVLLGMKSLYTDIEVPYDELPKDTGMEIVKRYDGINDFVNIKNLISNDKEGFVIRFKNGFRMKIKGDEYIRLHKIVTNISNRDIWEYLKKGEPLDEILNRVPDEFYKWVKETESELRQQFLQIEFDYKNYFHDILDKVSIEDRKGFALEAIKYEHSSLLFNMKDGKDYKNKIWDLLYPSYTKPFSKHEN